eukprot:328494-Ditylum_brightwellii.AAC.1
MEACLPEKQGQSQGIVCNCSLYDPTVGRFIVGAILHVVQCRGMLGLHRDLEDVCSQLKHIYAEVTFRVAGALKNVLPRPVSAVTWTPSHAGGIGMISRMCVGHWHMRGWECEEAPGGWRIGQCCLLRKARCFAVIQGDNAIIFRTCSGKGEGEVQGIKYPA